MFAYPNISKDVTFANSMEIPFQRWYPYIEGYSPNFVTSIIKQYCNQPTCIYEPFAGTGTTIFAADSLNINCLYSEINPLLRFIISTKLQILSLPISQRLLLSQELLTINKTIISDISHCIKDNHLLENYNSTFGNSIYFNQDTFDKILRTRTYIDDLHNNNPNLANLITIALLSSLIPISFLKKQGDVRFKTEKEKQNIPSFEDYIKERICIIAHDLANYKYQLKAKHNLICSNAKLIGQTINATKISDVITSPPYLNGTNYIRNTKLELWFLRYLKNKNDLRTFRDEVITSGINDVVLKKTTNNTIDDELFLHTIYQIKSNTYDKRITAMAIAYFEQMQQLFAGLKIHLNNNANVMIDIGDSVFAGVHIKTDDILVNILKPLGFDLIEKVLLRKRYSHNGQLISQVLIAFKYQNHINYECNIGMDNIQKYTTTP